MRYALSLVAALVATVVFTSDASAFGLRKKCHPKPTCGSTCGSPCGGYVSGGCR